MRVGRVSQILGDAGAEPSWRRDVADTLKHAPPIMCYQLTIPNKITLGQTAWACRGRKNLGNAGAQAVVKPLMLGCFLILSRIHMLTARY